jgi:hypothetical protein
MDDNPIQRCWRDVHAISSHVVMNWDVPAENFGRMEFGLGLNPAYPMFGRHSGARAKLANPESTTPVHRIVPRHWAYGFRLSRSLSSSRPLRAGPVGSAGMTK